MNGLLPGYPVAEGLFIDEGWSMKEDESGNRTLYIDEWDVIPSIAFSLHISYSGSDGQISFTYIDPAEEVGSSAISDYVFEEVCSSLERIHRQLDSYDDVGLGD
ncbi:MAG: hypothetical protein ABIH52_00065 [Candidatus Aenigmatarchaeota archaeon]